MSPATEERGFALGAPAAETDLPYVCPACAADLRSEGSDLVCSRCHTVYPVREGIPVFTGRPGYWCNVPRHRLVDVIRKAEASGDWREVVEREIPVCAPAIVPLHRADARFLLPMGRDSRVLDAGSMWGGLSVPLAQVAGEVHSLDKTWETLRLLKTRILQDGIPNVFPVVSPLRRLPFPDGFFDVTVLNGVLEWVALEEDVVIDRDWSGRRNRKLRYTKRPRDAQIEVLRELRRVTAPGGIVYVAIENRWGMPYWFGHPDDHVNVRFVPFLPRRLANLVVRARRGVDYRTHIHSPPALAEMLREVGFTHVEMFSAHPHYGKPWSLVSFDDFEDLRESATTAYGRRDVALFSLVWKRTPRPMTRWVTPSIAAVGSGPERPRAPWLLDLLEEAGVLDRESDGDHRVALVNSRFEDSNPVVARVQEATTGKTRWVCKIARRPGDRFLLDEAEELRFAASRVRSTPLEGRIPEVAYAGVHDGIAVLAMTPVSGRRIDIGILAGLRRLGRFLPLDHGVFGAPLRVVQRFGSRLWRARTRRALEEALRALAVLQCATRTGSTTVAALAAETLPSWGRRALTDRDEGGRGEEGDLEEVRHCLRGLPDLEIPLVFRHGDFDICNLLVGPDGVAFVDFEHAGKDALPTFDVGNLLFSPLIQEWRDAGRREHLVEFARATGWEAFITDLLERYAKDAKIDTRILADLPTLAVLEQQVIEYPDHRDPTSYPMRDPQVMRQMLSWALPLGTEAG